MLTTRQIERARRSERALGRQPFRASRTLLALFFVLLLFEGALRKWVFPGADLVVQGVRDALPMSALLVYALERARAGSGARVPLLRDFPRSLYGYMLIALLTGFMSAQQSVLIPLLGLRTHFAYLPLAILIPAILAGEGRLRAAVNATLILGLPICALALYQTTQPQFSEINIYGTGVESGATFGQAGLVRASGTFSYITGMGFFAQFLSVCSVFIFVTTKKLSVRILAFAALQAGLVACFSTGSRGALFGVAIHLLLIVVLCPTLITRLGGLHILRYAVAGFLTFWAVSNIAPDQTEAFLDRVDSSSGDEAGRIWDALFEWISALAQYPLGEGIGSGHLAAADIMGRERGFAGEYEAELSRIAYELGILGFVFFAWFRITVITDSLRIVRRMTTFEQRMLGSIAFSFVIMHSTGAMYTPIANAIFWTSLGVLYLLSRSIPAQSAHRRAPPSWYAPGFQRSP